MPFQSELIIRVTNNIFVFNDQIIIYSNIRKILHQAVLPTDAFLFL